MRYRFGPGSWTTTVLLAVGQMEVGEGLGVSWTPDSVIVASGPESVSKGEVYVAVGVVVGEDDEDKEDDEDVDGIAGDVASFGEVSLSMSVGVGWDDAASDSDPDPFQSISNLVSCISTVLKRKKRNKPFIFAKPTPNPTESPMTAATSTPSATHSQNNFFFPIPCCTGGWECPCPCPYPPCIGYPNPGPCRNTASRPGWVCRFCTASLKESSVVVVV